VAIVYAFHNSSALIEWDEREAILYIFIKRYLVVYIEKRGG